MNNANSRVRFTLILSCADFEYQTALHHLAPQFGKHFAGACFSQIDGCWSEEGHLLQSTYADVHIESGMRIMVSVMPDAKAQAYEQIQSIIKQARQALSWSLNWVHVEAEEVEALHFEAG